MSSLPATLQLTRKLSGFTLLERKRVFTMKLNIYLIKDFWSKKLTKYLL